jgi:hypothetical protein
MVFGSEGGKRTNMFSVCSHCVLLGSSFLWLCIKRACAFWLCLGVATFLATWFLMVVLFIVLLHVLAWALLHEHMVLNVASHCYGTIS